MSHIIHIPFSQVTLNTKFLKIAHLPNSLKFYPYEINKVEIFVIEGRTYNAIDQFGSPKFYEDDFIVAIDDRYPPVLMERFE